MPFCPSCRTELPPSVEFCEVCGTQAVERLTPKSHVAPKKSHAEKPSSKMPTKVLKLGIGVVAAFVAVLILFSIIIPTGTPDGFLYTKEEGLYFSTTDSKSKKVSDEEFSTYSTAKFSSDGKKIFYKEQDGGKLLYKNTYNLEKAPVSLSVNVIDFSINKKGNLVTYTKGSDSDLYQNNLKSQGDKIDESVVWFVTDDSGKRILYSKQNKVGSLELWIYKSGKKPEKIVTGYDAYYALSDDLNSFYFTKNGAVYKYSKGKEAEKIIDNYSEIIAAYKTGEIYYSCKSDHNTELCYYNGKTAETITDKFTARRCAAVDRPVVVFYFQDPTRMTTSNYIAVKDNITELDYDISEAHIDATGDELRFISDVNPASLEGTLYKATVNDDTVKSIKDIEANVLRGAFANDGEFIYLANYDKDTNTAELYRNEKKIDADVNADSIIYIPQKDSIIYFKDLDIMTGTMYLFDGKKSLKVDENVQTGEVFVAESGDVVYIRNFGSDLCGELCVFKGTKSKLIDEKVELILKISTYAKEQLSARGYLY